MHSPKVWRACHVARRVGKTLRVWRARRVGKTLRVWHACRIGETLRVWRARRVGETLSLSIGMHDDARYVRVHAPKVWRALPRGWFSRVMTRFHNLWACTLLGGARP